MAKPVTGLITFGTSAGPDNTGSLDTNYNLLAAALNDLGTYGNFLQDTSGAANSLVCSTAIGITVSLVAGLRVEVKVANTNTGNVTLAINALPATPVLNPDGSQLTPSEILAGGLYTFEFDGVNFQIQGSSALAIFKPSAGEIAVGIGIIKNSGWPVGWSPRYGILFDSGTDNTTAIQNMVNANAGATCYFRGVVGQYAAVTGAISVPANTSFFLEDGAAIQCTNAAAAALLSITGNNVLIYGTGSLTFNASMVNSNIISGTSVNNLRIRDVSLVGNQSASGTPTASGNGIYLTTCNDVEIDNVSVTQCVQGGIRINGANTGSTRIKITRNKVTNITSIGGTIISGIHGIALEDFVTDVLIQSNKVDLIGTQANNTGGIGIVVIQETLGFTLPSNIRILDNEVSNCCQHGIIFYASSLVVSVFDPKSMIDNNNISNTGLSLLAGNGGPANSLGNGIYCADVIPGSISNNVTSNTHVNAVSSSIADAAIAVVVETGNAIIATALSMVGNSSSLCNRYGLWLQRISGVTVSGHNATGCLKSGLTANGVKNFVISGNFSDNGSSASAGISFGTGGLGSLANGVANGVLDVTVSGFTQSWTPNLASNITGFLRIDGYTSLGLGLDTCTDVHVKCMSPYVSDHPAVKSTTANTNCTIVLDGPNRAASNCPYIFNSSTGLRCTFEADGVPNSGVMAFGVGDRAMQRTPTASNPDYWRCVTGGTSGTYVFKAGANLAP